MTIRAGVYFDVASYSGASSQVGHFYESGTSRLYYYLCGNNDKPAYALRTHAGP